MADTGWHNPGTAIATAEGLAGGTFTNPTRVTAEDGLFSTASFAKFNGGGEPETGATLKATDFSLAVPPSATITGIEARIVAAGTNIGESAYLGILDTPAIVPYGTHKANYWGPTGQTVVETFVWGSSIDLWGTSDLSPVVVNDPLFGWVYQIWDPDTFLAASVDSMQLKIHYEEAQTATMMGAGF